MKDNLELWRKINTYKLWQATLLIIGQSPDEWAISKILVGDTPNGFLPIFEKMIEDAKEYKSYKDEVDENVFQTVTIFDDFVLMTYNINDKENRTYEEWLSTEVSKGEMRDWVKLRGYKTNFFTDGGLAEFETIVQMQSINPRAHVSDNLAILNQAALKFWANADPKDNATHPINPTVASWLVSRGYSQALAGRGATIIRPEWATKGRKADK
jgi:hypothetical protein